MYLKIIGNIQLSLNKIQQFIEQYLNPITYNRLIGFFLFKQAAPT